MWLCIEGFDVRVYICGCMSHDNIDIFEAISIPSKAFWFILESSLKRNGDEDYKVPEAFTTWKLFLIYKNLPAKRSFSHSISMLADACRKTETPAY